VISLTKSQKGKPTAGDDDIPDNLAKQCVQLINPLNAELNPICHLLALLRAHPILHVSRIRVKGPSAHIYNLSLNSGIFPDIWKTAEVKSLYKKGDKYDMKNYTPISIITVFAKLLERLMYDRIKSLLYEKKILSEAQNGFRKGKSIDTAVQSFIGRIQKALDKRVHTTGIFIDLTKAYDVLNHKLLVEKLFYYGKRGSTNLWFRSYLTHRK